MDLGQGLGFSASSLWTTFQAPLATAVKSALAIPANPSICGRSPSAAWPPERLGYPLAAPAGCQTMPSSRRQSREIPRKPPRCETSTERRSLCLRSTLHLLCCRAKPRLANATLPHVTEDEGD